MFTFDPIHLSTADVLKEQQKEATLDLFVADQFNEDAPCICVTISLDAKTRKLS